MNLLMSLATSFADSSFARLFTDMNPWCIGLFVLGIVFCLIEVFMPGFGFFGISGILCIVVGMILRLVWGGDAWMLVYMLVIFTLLLCGMFFLLGRLINKSKGKNSIFHIGTAVPEDRTEGTKDFSYLVGKSGVTTTTLHPIGKAKFDGQVVDVVAEDGFIAQDMQIKVISVEGQRVLVVELKEE